MLSPLATSFDATLFDLTVTNAALLRASNRVRAYVDQQITYGTSTVVLPRSNRRLPQRPVVAVSSVVDEDGATLTEDTDWELDGDTITTTSTDKLTVTYEHGLTELPDALVEVVCTIGARIQNMPAELQAGAQQQGAGPFQVTYGWDSHKAASGLTQGEKDALDRIWPRTPRTITMGAPAT